MQAEWQVRRELTVIGRRLYERGYVSATDGNLSARVARNRLLVSPAGACLGALRPQDLLYAAIDGTPLARGARPTSELPMHLAVYAVRADVGAIVHAHPVHATALSLAGLDLREPVLPELTLHLGSIPTAPYATLATAEGARAVRDLVRDHDALILDRHGTLTLGADPISALQNLERLEHGAQIVAAAHRLGRLRTLSPEECAGIAALRDTAAEAQRGTR
ncbi:MAG: class II aldolase/adducin family protein [Candidatus Eisenbacteria bacterium]|nr:class II aldolase/adducin family protein [Candidatus Eisenbacteria bacterium]